MGCTDKSDNQLMEENHKLKVRLAKEKRRNHIFGMIRNLELIQIIRHVWNRIFRVAFYTTKGNKVGSTCCGMVNSKSFDVIVYSCIIGDYDVIKEPEYKEDGVRYMLFTDRDVPVDSLWEKIDITQFNEYVEFGPYKLNRLLKMFPERFLPQCDYSIYVDGSIKIVCGLKEMLSNVGTCTFGLHFHPERDCAYDEAKNLKFLGWSSADVVNAQIKKYRCDGFPSHFGLFENMVLVRKYDDLEVKKMMQAWWNEYCSFPTRDQISLPYAMWLTNFDKSKIFILGGSTFFNNDRFRRIEHPHNPKYRSDK